MRQAEKMAGNFYDEVESTYGWVAEEEEEI